MRVRLGLREPARGPGNRAGWAVSETVVRGIRRESQGGVVRWSGVWVV